MYTKRTRKNPSHGKMIQQTSIERKFFKFVYKRFVLKESPPWTDDKILQTYKFINMYRELDRCTLYLMQKLHGIKNRKELFLNVVFFRFFNKDGIYEMFGINPLKILDIETKSKLTEKLNTLKKEGKTIFNDAYLISSGKFKNKHVSVIESMYELSKNLNSFIVNIDNSKTPQESFEIIKKIKMVGPFLACEIWTDLVYLRFFRQNWTDDDFVNIGPGAEWGLEIIYGKLSKKQQMARLRELHETQRQILPSINIQLNKKLPWREIAYKEAFSNCPFLSLTNVEGALCEFRKYWNLSNGKGKKRYFKPKTDKELIK